MSIHLAKGPEHLHLSLEDLTIAIPDQGYSQDRQNVKKLRISQSPKHPSHSFKIEKWLKTNREILNSKNGIKFHEWLEPSDWSKLLSVSHVLNQLLLKEKNHVVSGWMTRPSRRVNFFNDSKSSFFLFNQALMTDFEFNGSIHQFCNLNSKTRKIEPVFFCRVSKLIEFLKDKTLGSFLNDKVCNFLLLEDRFHKINPTLQIATILKSELESTISNFLAKTNYNQSSNILTQENRNYFEMMKKKWERELNFLEGMAHSKPPCPAAETAKQKDISLSINKIEIGYSHFRRFIEKIDCIVERIDVDAFPKKLQWRSWDDISSLVQIECENIRKENIFLSNFFQTHFGLIHLESPERKLVQYKVFTLKSLNAMMNDYLEDEKLQETSESKEPEDSFIPDEVQNFCKPFQKKSNIIAGYPQNLKIDNLLNIKEDLFPQTLQCILVLLKEKHENFELDLSYLSFQPSFDSIQENFIKAIDSSTPLVMIPIELKGKYAMICIDKENVKVEYYDSIGNTSNTFFLKYYVQAYFPQLNIFKFEVEDEGIIIKRNHRKQFPLEKNLSGMFMIDFCQKRILGMTLQEIDDKRPIPMELLGQRIQWADLLLNAQPAPVPVSASS